MNSFESFDSFEMADFPELYSPICADQDNLILEMTDRLKIMFSKDGTKKGLICSHDDTLLVDTFPIPMEYALPSESESFQATETIPTVVYEAIEGTLIRVYQFEDQWHLSTSSRLDAYACSWSAPMTFGDQFEEYVSIISGVPLDVFLCSLDPQLKYFFILPTEDTNRIGKYPDPSEVEKIYLVGLQDQTNRLFWGESLQALELDKNIWTFPDRVQIDGSFERLLHLMQTSEKNYIFYESSEGIEGVEEILKIVKCCTDEYASRVHIRNNEADIILRYLQLQVGKDVDANLIHYFQCMYPEYPFEQIIEEGIAKATRHIHKKYISRFIRKEYVNVQKNYFEIMQLCHENFKRSKIKITASSVKEIILKQEPSKIISLIRNFLF